MPPSTQFRNEAAFQAGGCWGGGWGGFRSDTHVAGGAHWGWGARGRCVSLQIDSPATVTQTVAAPERTRKASILYT